MAFENEWNAFERTSKLSLINYNTGYLYRSCPLDIFKEKANQYLNLFEFSDKDINNISSLIDRIPHLEDKNALCFLISYNCIKNKKIDTSKLKSFVDKDLENSFRIKIEDKLRYCKLILKYID